MRKGHECNCYRCFGLNSTELERSELGVLRRRIPGPRLRADFHFGGRAVVQRTSLREPLESLGFSALADRRLTRKPTRNGDDDHVTDIIAVTDRAMEAWYHSSIA
jgi:hypothetical protein